MPPSRRAILISLLALVVAVPASLAGNASAPVPAAACPNSHGPVSATPLASLESAQAQLEKEVGFVDLVYVAGPQPAYRAVFDAEARGGLPLPTAPVVEGGVPIVVAAEHFTKLIAPLRTANDPPLIPETCANRISPGSNVSTPVGGCTANFIFRDAAGLWYVGTAGHCFSALGQRLTVNGLGQVGTVVYDINAGVGEDFALVRVDANKVANVNPAMCQWGGPTGLDHTGPSDVMRHYGFGIGYGTIQFTRARTGFGGTNAGHDFSFAGLVDSGDSGSGARRDDGSALGIITHVNGGLLIVGHSAPLAYGTRLSHAIDLAEAGTGLTLTLQTAPVA